MPESTTTTSKSTKNEKDNPTTTTQKDTSYNQSNFTRQTNVVKDLFSIPKPIKILFDKVPVFTYPANELPQRSPGANINAKRDRDAGLPSLYIFCREGEEVNGGRPSFNPGCLKWQTFLKLAGVDHKVVSSNNHASPTGVLPFLLPPIKSNGAQEKEGAPIPSHGLVKYARERGKKLHELKSRRLEAYQALLDHNIRNAWLHTLYLTPTNFQTIATPLYINPTSSSALVRLVTSQQLRAAAEEELRKSRQVIDGELIYEEADRAWEALSLLLGEDRWFGGEGPAVLMRRFLLIRG